MRARLTVLVALVVAVTLLLPASAWSVGKILDSQAGLVDFDVRTESLPPSAEQRSLVERLGAQAIWNQYGTPSSLVKHGGYLATGVEGGTAIAAAKAWLAANRGIFRLDSTAGLELFNDSPLVHSEGHAISFRQTFGELEATDGGLVTVGLAPGEGGWNVASASSTVTGDETLTGSLRLGPEQAWLAAAASIGEPHSLVDIDKVNAVKAGAAGWDALHVARLDDVQRVRAVAFPTVRAGVVPAYETIVLNTDVAEPVAYRIFVDGRTGEVLARQSLVDNAHDGPSPTFSFEGILPPVDGGCDVRKGPYTVTADAHVRAIDVFANADSPLQDIVLRLYFGTTLVASADTFNTPERIRYSPASGVPPGDYFVEVCEFDDTANTPPLEPRTYRGTVTLDTSAPPAPYLARWKVFPANPPLHTLPADPWNNPSTDTRALWCWRATAAAADCNRVVGNLAARAPWDHDVKGNFPTGTTVGNNAVTAESWTDPFLPSPNQFRPTSPTRDYSFPWTNSWNTNDCNPGTPYGSAFVAGESFDVSAAVTNLFAMHNRMHDWSYFLGFNEDNWNGQASNFGLTEAFRENDPVVGNAQAGAALPPPLVYAAARDNANMITLPDGQSSITNMYFWQPLAGSFYAPCVDGDYDMGVIGHEYAHMIENRMIGKGVRRSGHHAGAMGESHSDLLSIEQLNESGFVPTSDENRWATGTYATGNKLRGIRNYAGNFPPSGAFPEPSVYPQIDPLNFSDFGYDVTGPQVHADGEIWTATNFSIRRALAAKYDAAFPESDTALQSRCADGLLPPESCPGNRRWIQLVLDSFLLMPTAPSMIDARNAILAADTLRFGGANQSELWLAFAQRGFG
ncbi:MAG: M36 family metallopeptidase, partial [Actinobacteria bacterium]|nr:M36 family metallopeptidase [Actinomycetota bacterium]